MSEHADAVRVAVAAPQIPATQVRRESIGGVIGVALGLAVLLGLTAWLLRPVLPKGGRTSAELLEELMPAPRPFGLELEEHSRLAAGNELLRLAPAAGSDKQPVDSVILALYTSPAEIVQLFARPMQGMHEVSQRMREWERDPKFEWHAEMDRGVVAWSGWRADYVRERAFAEGGGFRDATRVNLSQGGRYLVLFALWPPDTESSQDVLKELVASVAVAEETAAAAGH